MASAIIVIFISMACSENNYGRSPGAGPGAVNPNTPPGTTPPGGGPGPGPNPVPGGKVGEEQDTTRDFKLGDSVVTASVFYTDESIGGDFGDISIILSLAIDKKAYAKAGIADDHAIAEAAVAETTFKKKVRVVKTVKRYSVQLECKEPESAEKK